MPVIYDKQAGRLPIERPFGEAVRIYFQRLRILLAVAAQSLLLFLVVDTAVLLGRAFPFHATVVITVLGGVGLGALNIWIYRVYLTPKTIRSISDMERNLNLAALALIPHSGFKSRSPLDRETRFAMGSSSAVQESYRHLRTSILLSSMGNPPKSILFTSGTPGSGRTTTALNAAISLAQTGAKVLLVDADLRRPQIHRNLNVSNAVGLSTYLAGQSSEVDLEHLLQPHPDFPGVSVLTAGPLPPNPAELIASERMIAFIRAQTDRFNFMVFDSPPLNLFQDALVLSTMVDGVILVVGYLSSITDVQLAKDLLLDVGAEILGAVLNEVPLRDLGNSTYYYSSYYEKPNEANQSGVHAHGEI